MQNKHESNEKLSAFREIVELLVNSCLILSIQEKEEILKMTPKLELVDLIEIFNLLTGAKTNVDEILETLAREYPKVMDDLKDYQLKTLKSIYKGRREALNIK